MARLVQFAEFRLDPATGRLWRQNEALELTPKAYSLLEYLTSQPQQLIPKETLMDAMWGDAFVGDAVLKVAIAELRRVLGDDAREPRFIETVHRRGYRFIGTLAASAAPETETALVGRQEQLRKLKEALTEAQQGRRQTVFITGEPGIGKTALVEAMLSAAPANWLVARGRCLQQYGESEPYLPVFDALHQLARTTETAGFVSHFRQHAPTWLTQMPALITIEERESLSRQVMGATRERMLREMAEALESLSARCPLVVALEDLHWSDVSTVDLVSALAWRSIPARFLLVVTYRPVEVIVQEHPVKALKQDLLVEGRALELSLDLLSEPDVRAIIARRYPGHTFPDELTAWVHERTSGNPLFLMNVLDFAVQGEAGNWSLRAPLDELAREAPDTLRQMIGKQVERLAEAEQEMLEAAAVAGVDFSTIAVGAGLGHDPLLVEEQCERLARRGQFLASSGVGELPNGTVAARFRFLHPLYQTVLYQRIGPARRVRLHQRIGEQGELVYGERAGEIAAELAMQFESARDYRRAIKYLRQAANHALRCYANREAVDFLTRALEWSAKIPEPERTVVALQLLEERGFAYRSMGEMRLASNDFGMGVEMARAKGDLSWQVRALLFQVSALSWLDHDACLTLADEAVLLSGRMEDEAVKAHARGYSGYWHFVLRGWRAEDAEASREAIRVLRKASQPELLGMHLARYSYFQSLCSEYEEGVRLAEEAMKLAFQNGDAFEYILSQYFRIWALFFSGRWGELRRELRQAITLATENGHRQWLLLFRLMHGWLYVELDEFEHAREVAVEGLREAAILRHPLSRQIALVLLGFSHLGLNEVEEAEKAFAELAQWLQVKRVLMDWIWWIPLCRGRSRCAFARGDLAAARRWADEACARAAVPGERTWLSLAHLERSRILRGLGDDDGAAEQLKEALRHAGDGTPLAVWRLHEYAVSQGRVGRHKEEMLRMVTSLRDSLDPDDELRESALFRRVLSRAKTRPV